MTIGFDANYVDLRKCSLAYNTSDKPVLGSGLIEEGRAEDGLIEAFRVAEAAQFAVAVQWHPEWLPQENPFSTALFQAFGDAARERAAASVLPA